MPSLTRKILNSPPAEEKPGAEIHHIYLDKAVRVELCTMTHIRQAWVVGFTALLSAPAQVTQCASKDSRLARSDRHNKQPQPDDQKQPIPRHSCHRRCIIAMVIPALALKCASKTLQFARPDQNKQLQPDG